MLAHSRCQELLRTGAKGWYGLHFGPGFASSFPTLLASAGHELRCGTEVSPQMLNEANYRA